MITAVSVEAYLLSGSSMPLVVLADDGERYLVKMRSSGEGVLHLACEWIGLKIAGALGLPVLTPRVIHFSGNERIVPLHDEVTDLVLKGAGENLALPYLADAVPAHQSQIPAALAAMIRAVDVMLGVPDRTERNLNIIHSGSDPIVVDFGSAMVIRAALTGMDWNGSPRLLCHPFDHSLAGIDACCDSARKLDATVVRDIVGSVPADWLPDAFQPGVLVDSIARTCAELSGPVRDAVFAAELEALAPYCYAVCYKIITNPTEAEDLAQEALLKAWANRQQLADAGKLRPWLRRIAVNVCYASIRSSAQALSDVTTLEGEGLEWRIADPAPGIEAELIADEQITAVRNGCFLAMARKLTVHQRMAFSLVEMFELGIDECAAVMGISSGAVKGLLVRARRNIGAFFESRCEWMSAGAPCHCSAWFDFAGRREDNRRELAGRSLLVAFPDDPGQADVRAETVRRITAIYRAIPDRVPGDEWYQRVTDQLKKISVPVSAR